MDADGRPRNVDSDLNGAALPDVGAFENQKEATRLRFDSRDVLAWDDSVNAAVTFDLYRDALSPLAPGPIGDCLFNALSAPTATDTAILAERVEVASVARGGGRFVILHRREGIYHVWLWETESGKHRELISHSGDVHGAAFFRDGQRVVTVGEDRTMRLWDSLTGRELLSVTHAGPVRRVAVSPDGRSILTVGHPQGMVIWKIPGWGDIVSQNEQHDSSSKGDEHERKIGRATAQP